MAPYILSILSLLLSFMALISSLRFLFSRQAPYWIIPIIISLILSLDNLNSIFSLSALDSNVNLTVSSLLPFLLSISWYSMIISFRFALKIAIPENRYLIDSKKNLNEALYLEKVETRKNRKQRKEKEERIINKTNVPRINSYNGPDIG